jgi:F-type H+-transporting ATPase subunit epsilon
MATDAALANKIRLEVVTPRGRALEETADEVTAPSVEGEFGVMPGHLPLLAALQTGLVSYKQGGELKKVAVGPGFAECSDNQVLILTDEFIERAQIDPVLVRKELAEVQAELAKLVATGEPVDANAEPLIKRENWLATQLELYGDPPPATMRPFERYGPPPPPDDSETPVAEPGHEDKVS